MSDRTQLLRDTRAARDQAQSLLAALTNAKTALEAESASKADLFKRVTGQSSLETSLAQTRRAIDAYERLIPQLEKDLVPEVIVTARLADTKALA